MSVRSRARAFLVPLFFYIVLGGASFYMVKNASRGSHGTAARVQFNRETSALKVQLATLYQARERWQHRVNALRDESIDRDLLDEEAHRQLNYVAKDEVMMFVYKH